jgi:hypothetical protein
LLTIHVQQSGAYHWDILEKILWGMQKQDKLDKISLGKSMKKSFLSTGQGSSGSL